MVIPQNFIIYTNGRDASVFPIDGYTKTTLPVNNEFATNPGCYIACYTQNPERGVYSPQPDVYVIGLIRVGGSYAQRNCVPLGYIRRDITKDPDFRGLCETKYPSCAGSRCWANPDTGGWLGIVNR